jgi:hypothetical protein
MKRIVLFQSFLLFFLTASCTITFNDDELETKLDCEERCDNGVSYFNSFSVETITLEELKAKIGVETTIPYKETGKLYFYNNRLFVNQPKVGVHVLDVSNPANMQKTKFIRHPGNIDISIQKDILYADLY